MGMVSAPVWIITLNVWLAFLQILVTPGNSKLDLHVGRKITKNNNPGFISIDCGSNINYTDEETGIWYQTDENFVEAGINHRISPAIDFNFPYFGKLLQTLRIFPEGERNCYTLKPEHGKNNSYLIRAFFGYGNYDGKNQTPSFDLYLGVNYWDTLGGTDSTSFRFREIIHTPTTDAVQVCLVKTGPTIPYIASLELRLLNTSIYRNPIVSADTTQPLLKFEARVDIGGIPTKFNRFSRYRDDVYDRMWRYYSPDGWDPLDLDESIDIDPGTSDNAYKLPSQVLRSAARSKNVSDALEFDFDAEFIETLDKSSKYFAEIEQLQQGKKRIINVTLNSQNILSHPLVREYLKPVTITPLKAPQGYVRFSISATSESDAPPILNAFEVHKLITQLLSPTDTRDVGAILEIKNAYQISWLNWQGDPCVPNQLKWEGLKCSSDSNNPRIKFLDLSSSKLTGKINIAFSYLIELEFLDLSDNELAGPLPEFLAELPKLKILNLTGNKLSGSIPKALKEKADTTLQLSLTDNPALCITDSCKKQNFVVPIVASISSLIVILLISLGIWIFRRKQTDEIKALIYEYMPNGNLLQHLSDPNILKWNERLHIAVDAAHGLDYLHSGCKPPLVHRDLKTSNILLDQNMQAKIADFGLCRAFVSDIDSHISTRPAGTPGYVDPEFQRTGNSNKKSDVYSFGIILFELITGQPALLRASGKITHILQWVIPIIERGDIKNIVDPRLQGEFNTNSAWKVVEIALSCISSAAAERPDTSHILVELKECLSSEMVQSHFKRSRSITELTSLQLESEIAPLAR